MILLRSTVTFWRCAAKYYNLFVIFAVLDLQRVAEVVLKSRFKLLSFFTIIFTHDRDMEITVCSLSLLWRTPQN